MDVQQKKISRRRYVLTKMPAMRRRVVGGRQLLHFTTVFDIAEMQIPIMLWENAVQGVHSRS